MNDTDPTHTPKANGTEVALAGGTKAYLVIDATAYEVPGTDLSVTASSDSGESTTDGITSDTTPEFGITTGYTIAWYSTIEVVDTASGQVLGKDVLSSAALSAGSYVFDSDTKLSSAFTDGSYTIALRVIDPAGNVSPNSNVVTAVIDTTAPDITLVRTAGADNAASTAGRKYIAAPADANGLANSNIQWKNISSSTTCNSTVTGIDHLQW